MMERPSAAAILRSPLEESNWARAMNLAERLALRRQPPRKPPQPPEDRNAAERHLNEWRSQTPFHLEDWWCRRLEFDGLDEDRFLELLGESGESLEARCRKPPAWLLRLAEAFSQTGVSDSPEVPIEQGAFTPVVAPLLRQAFTLVLERARELARNHSPTPFEPERAAKLLCAPMPYRLDGILSQSTVLEMHVARLEGCLQGETTEERFRFFLADLQRPAKALAFLLEYPVLARVVVESLGFWTEAAIELLGRLAADWALVRSTFCGGRDPGMLEEVTGGLGDQHRRGRAVRSLRFSSGLRLVYKPRPLAIDVRFSELLDWLNERGAPDLRAAEVLDRGAYGWSEFVAPRRCASLEEVRRFYRRQGAFVVLLYALGANDFHRENLIAAGEYPIPIDLESLCGADYGSSNPEVYDSIAEFELEHSVMRVMLLPYFHEGAGRKIMDTSGLGGEGGQMAVHDSPEWEGRETDQMRLVRRRIEIPPADNRPTLNGQNVDPFEFSEQIEEGFVAMYRLLVELRGELLEAGSPLLRFRDVELRSVLRASQFYGFILRESYHPDLLRDALDRDRHLDRMWFGIDRSKLAEQSLRLIRSEKEDLWRGDIPYFSTKVDSRDLWTSSGERLPAFFVRSGFEVVRSILDRLGEEDLTQQLWFLRGSLTALAMDVAPTWPKYELDCGAGRAGRDRLLETAVAAGERLAALAKRGQGRASWLGLAWTNNRGWWLRQLEYDLYSGLPGIILSLAYLGEITGREDFVRLAEEALATLQRQLERWPRLVQFLGGYDGWTGLVFTWNHLASLWGREELLAEALDMLPKIAPLIDTDEDLDILRGSAGGIVPLLALHRATGSDLALTLARQMGDRLIATARPFEEGRGWLVAASPLRALTGFSHGASGPAWALAELYGATADERYREIALQAVAFEDSTFSPEHANWPDQRIGPEHPEDAPPTFMAAWCHGACGIGLSRLRMLRHIAEPHIQRDAATAVSTTARKAFGFNHCLCHGDLGALELLLEASQTLEDGRWGEELERLAAGVLASIDEHGFICGVPLGVETPGLLDGLAGISYGLLRLAEPERVPSALLLDPPIAR